MEDRAVVIATVDARLRMATLVPAGRTGQLGAIRAGHHRAHKLRVTRIRGSRRCESNPFCSWIAKPKRARLPKRCWLPVTGMPPSCPFCAETSLLNVDDGSSTPSWMHPSECLHEHLHHQGFHGQRRHSSSTRMNAQSEKNAENSLIVWMLDDSLKGETFNPLGSEKPGFKWGKSSAVARRIFKKLNINDDKSVFRLKTIMYFRMTIAPTHGPTRCTRLNTRPQFIPPLIRRRRKEERRPPVIINK
ncbi:MAG: hypothetical protein U1F20_01300 [Lysobacterales bacterium]